MSLLGYCVNRTRESHSSRFSDVVCSGEFCEPVGASVASPRHAVWSGWRIVAVQPKNSRTVNDHAARQSNECDLTWLDWEILPSPEGRCIASTRSGELSGVLDTALDAIPASYLCNSVHSRMRRACQYTLSTAIGGS